jgi:hypothetical protein
MLLRVDLMRQRVAFTCREVSSQGLPPPRSPPKLLFSKLFMYFYVYFYCLQVNLNCLGFRLFVYVRIPFLLFLLFLIYSVSLEAGLDLNCHLLVCLSSLEVELDLNL